MSPFETTLRFEFLVLVALEMERPGGDYVSLLGWRPDARHCFCQCVP